MAPLTYNHASKVIFVAHSPMRSGAQWHISGSEPLGAGFQHMSLPDSVQGKSSNRPHEQKVSPHSSISSYALSTILPGKQPAMTIDQWDTKQRNDFQTYLHFCGSLSTSRNNNPNIQPWSKRPIPTTYNKICFVNPHSNLSHIVDRVKGASVEIQGLGPNFLSPGSVLVDKSHERQSPDTHFTLVLAEGNTSRLPHPSASL
jgi:hypothetical protein